MGIRIIANSRFDYILIKNESFNLSKILQEMKDKIRQKKYDEYQVSISELNELKLLEEEIKRRLEKILLQKVCLK